MPRAITLTEILMWLLCMMIPNLLIVVANSSNSFWYCVERGSRSITRVFGLPAVFWFVGIDARSCLSSWSVAAIQISVVAWVVVVVGAEEIVECTGYVHIIFWPCMMWWCGAVVRWAKRMDSMDSNSQLHDNLLHIFASNGGWRLCSISFVSLQMLSSRRREARRKHDKRCSCPRGLLGEVGILSNASAFFTRC